MNSLFIAVFVITYAAITLEHQLKLNKSAPALLGAGVLWSLYALYLGDNQALTLHLNESLVGTAQIIFFLLGAMTIVEVIDAHNGFEVITAYKNPAPVNPDVVGGDSHFFLEFCVG